MLMKVMYVQKVMYLTDDSSKMRMSRMSIFHPRKLQDLISLAWLPEGINIKALHHKNPSMQTGLRIALTGSLLRFRRKPWLYLTMLLSIEIGRWRKWEKCGRIELNPFLSSTIFSGTWSSRNSVTYIES